MPFNKDLNLTNRKIRIKRAPTLGRAGLRGLELLVLSCLVRQLADGYFFIKKKVTSITFGKDYSLKNLFYYGNCFGVTLRKVS